MSRRTTILTAIVTTLCCSSAMAAGKPLKVYILAGQSNMEGHARVETFDYIGDDPATAPMLKEMRGPDGKPRVCERVWISYLTGSPDKGTLGEGFGKLTAGFGARTNPTEDGGKIGPEFTFGLAMEKAYDGPILIIKTAWGGKSLHTDFRSPSGGPYEFGERLLEDLKKQGKNIEQVKADKVRATGRYYRLMLDHVKHVLADIKRVYSDYDPEQGYELAGFVWFQGWNDYCDPGTYPDRVEPGGYKLYSELMAHFIRDVRKELSAPNMPFVIGVMGVNGPLEQMKRPTDFIEVHRNFRAAMAAPAAMPEFKGNVIAVPTAPYFNMALEAIEPKKERLLGMKMQLMFKSPKGPNKDGKMTKEQQEAYLEDYKNNVVKLSPEEDALWNRAASNGGYHYFGSAKALGQIGKAFAEAMPQMAESGSVTGSEAAWCGWSASDSTAIQRNTTDWVRAADGQSVPLIAQADVLVVGSTLDGCFLADRLARLGRRVALASSGTSLPREIIMGLRPWVKPADLTNAPADVQTFLGRCVKAKDGNELFLDLIGVTEGLEDRVLDAGVRLYYDLHPCGVQTDGSRIAAVLFGCKGGLVAVEANAIVDCTQGARVARLAGARLAPRKSPDVFIAYSMLCEQPPDRRVMAVEGVPELVDGQIRMHGDYAEFRMRLPVSESVCDESTYNLEARRIAAETAAKLRRSAFKNSKFVRGGDVLMAGPATRVAGRADKHDRVSVDACRPRGVDNLLICSPAVDVEDDVAATLVEPLSGPSLADVLTAAPWDELMKASQGREKRINLSCAQPVSRNVDRSEAAFTELGPIFCTDLSIPISGVLLPIVADCEVLVVGAGTSGMPAAVVAAEHGADTIVVEKYGDVGGTHTIGAVSKYWYGRSTEFFERLDADARQTMQQTHMPKCMGKLSTMMKSGVRLLTHCTAVGAMVEGRTVAGIVVVTPQGLAAIKAERIVDATGDGDIAARAGSDMTYGTQRDAMTLWYSFAQFAGTNPEARRHFAYVVDPRDPTEMTRAIIAGRRYKQGSNLTAPQYYLTPRESRHIRGGYHVTVADILAERRFEDLLLVCRSNFDIKGIGDSDLTFSGYVEWSRLKEYSVQIPYRAIRPVDLQNILVVGKAYSISHDALALARMQRDMMAMGGAAGLIAAECAREDVSFANVDFKQVQKELLTLGVLSQQDLDTIKGVKDNALPAMSVEELRERINRLAAGQLPLDAQGQILARPKAAIPLLKDALVGADRKGQLELARALCFLGDPSGSPAVLGELERLLSGKTLPGISRGQVTPHDLPDHGFAPDATYLINTLARLGDRRIIPFMANIAKKVEPETDRTGTMFSYIFSVCYAAERLAATECIEALTILADKTGICGSSVPRGADPRRTARGSVSMREDRYAYLEFCLGRALARCGSRHGYQIVLDYLNDIRGFLARSAHDELVQLAGQNFGYDKQAWQTWLAKADIRPRPYHANSTAKRVHRNDRTCVALVR